jgi:hypothetical protein
MEFKKILSDQFCQAAILALRDLAIEFETANHVVYEYPPKEPRIDPYGYFMYSVHNEVRWYWKAENISKLSALYIPFYAQTRGLDPKKLDDGDARRIFLYMMIVELEDGNRACSMFNDYDTGFGYEGVLYILYAMGEEKAMQGFAKLHPEIDIWDVGDVKNKSVDFAGMMSLENLKNVTNEQAIEMRAMMLNYLFGNLLRESLLTNAQHIAKAAFSIQWDEVISYQTEKELKLFVEAHPDDYNNPNTACDAFFAALNSAAKAAPLMQLINKMDMDKLKQHILSLLPSYITYFERQSYGLFDIYHDLTAPSDENFQPIETKHDEGKNDETALAEDDNLPF